MLQFDLWSCHVAICTREGRLQNSNYGNLGLHLLWCSLSDSELHSTMTSTSCIATRAQLSISVFQSYAYVF